MAQPVKYNKMSIPKATEKSAGGAHALAPQGGGMSMDVERLHEFLH
jgi:hypothetical protein